VAQCRLDSVMVAMGDRLCANGGGLFDPSSSMPATTATFFALCK
jgi:hypothetical protein